MRTLAFLVSAIVICPPARLMAADELGVFVEFAEADASLNATYTRVMNALPPPSREQLRRAQRAWIMFVEKYVAALSSNSGSPQERWQFRLAETLARRELLEGMLNPQRSSDASQFLKKLRDADRELNTLYENSLANFKDDVQAAREAQRAWVIYRDEHARACPGSETETKLVLTAQRVAQLRTVSVAKVEPVEAEEEIEPRISQEDETIAPGRKVPNPFERAR